MVAKGLIQIKVHTQRKYNILGKYLTACRKFDEKYQNFVYIDTHGGTGEVFNLDKNQQDSGSVLIAAKIKPTFPVYAIEIDPERFKLLKKSTANLSNVTCFHGNCNDKIDEVLATIPKEQKFCLCFIDPDSLIYHGKNFSCLQLQWETINKVAKFPRMEILLNLPIESIMRLVGHLYSLPDLPTSQKYEEYLMAFYGTDKYKIIDAGDYRSFLRLFIAERLKRYYNFIGAILIRSVITNAPLYYLVYCSNHNVGAKIMRGIMKKEWIKIKKGYPVSRFFYKADEQWLNSEYPLKMFIFED